MVPPGKYDGTIRLLRRCGLMSNYFDHSLFIIIAGMIRYRDDAVAEEEP